MITREEIIKDYIDGFEDLINFEVKRGMKRPSKKEMTKMKKNYQEKMENSDVLYSPSSDDAMYSTCDDLFTEVIDEYKGGDICA